MPDFKKPNRSERRRSFRLCLLLIATLFSLINTAPASEKLSIVPKWSRFEHVFKSSVNYEKPFQDCTFSAIFTSPTGETNLIYGFWDGGKTWRLRFSPDQPGRWTYRTTCSDPTNRKLQNQAGAFLCTAPIGTNRFDQHGPIRVSRDHTHFEHQDGTPFFWMADSLENGMRLANPVEFNAYARVRAIQRFTAAQWSVTPGRDLENQVAFLGRPQIVPNPEFFQRLDAKIDMMNHAGLLSVIAPLWNADRESIAAVSEEQLVLLMRYVAARWNSYNVAWLLDAATNSISPALPKLATELHSGHTPVVVFQSELLKKTEPIADTDALGYVAFHDDSNRLAHAASERSAPVIGVASPSENSLAEDNGQRIAADSVRESVWKNLLSVSPAGMTYSADAVENWRPEKSSQAAGELALWQKSMFLPGGKQMSIVADFFSSIPFWQLRPAPEMIVPGESNITAAANADRSFAVFYIPKGATLELTVKALPSTPEIRWLNPRTGKQTPAIAVIGPNSVKFPSPEQGDWVLLLRAKR
jgi:hypothetical protein